MPPDKACPDIIDFDHHAKVFAISELKIRMLTHVESKTSLDTPVPAEIMSNGAKFADRLESFGLD